MNDCAPEGVILGVENQSGQGIGGITDWRWNAFNNGLQDFFNADAFLGGTFNMRIRIESQFRIYFFENTVNISGRQINFIDNRNDREIVFHRKIQIG